MSRLLAIIDDYKDRHGQPSDASIARAAEIAPQTISSWRHRGIRNVPEPVTLARLARFIGVEPVELLLAAGVDANYLSDEQMAAILGRTQDSAGEVGDDGRSASM